MSTALSLLIGTGGLFEFDATLPFFVTLFITWVYLLTELVYAPLAENIEAELEKTLKYQLYLREWFSLLEKKSLPLKLWKDKNLTSRSLGLGDFGWVGNQKTNSTNEDVNFFYLNLFFQSLGVDSSWRFEPDRQTSIIKQDPRSFLDLIIPGLINGTSIEESRLRMQQLEVGLPGQVLMEKRLFGADGYTDKPFFVVLAHEPSSPGTWDFGKRYSYMVGSSRADQLIAGLLGVAELRPGKLPKFSSDTLQNVERRLQEELEKIGGGKTKFNPITGMATAHSDGGIPISSSQHFVIMAGSNVPHEPQNGSQGRIRRQKVWSRFRRRCIEQATDQWVIEEGLEAAMDDYRSGTSQKELTFCGEEFPLRFWVPTDSCLSGFPETMKVEMDETIDSQLLVSEVIAAVPCGLKGIPQELESGLPGFVAHDLSDKTKEFAYLTVLFLGICPAQAVYRGSVLLSLGIDLEGQLYNFIEDRLSILTDDVWWRSLMCLLRAKTREICLTRLEAGMITKVNELINSAGGTDAGEDTCTLHQVLEHEMSELLETRCMVIKEELESLLNVYSTPSYNDFIARQKLPKATVLSDTEVATRDSQPDSGNCIPLKAVEDLAPLDRFNDAHKWPISILKVPENSHDPSVFVYAADANDLPAVGTNLVIYTGSTRRAALFPEELVLWMPRLLRNVDGFVVCKVTEWFFGPDQFPFIWKEPGRYDNKARIARAVALGGTEGLQQGMRGVPDPLDGSLEWHTKNLKVLLKTMVAVATTNRRLLFEYPHSIGVGPVWAASIEKAWRCLITLKPLTRGVYGGHMCLEKSKVQLKGVVSEEVKVLQGWQASDCQGKRQLRNFIAHQNVEHYLSTINIPVKFIPKKERFDRFLQEYVSAVTAIFTAENDRRFYWYWYIRSTVEKDYLYRISQIRYRLCKNIVNVWVKLRIGLVMIYDKLRLKEEIKFPALYGWLDKLVSLRSYYPKRKPLVSD